MSSALTQLKELIAAVTYRPREHRFTPDLRSGLPVGAICEVSGSGKTEFVARYLAANPEMRVAWIEDELSVYPTALKQRDADLNRILFVEAGKESYWTVLQALRSQIFGTVIFSSTTTGLGDGRLGVRPPTTKNGIVRCNPTGQEFYRDERALRSLQLSAEKSRATLILLSDEPGNAWPVSLQLRVKRTRVELGLIQAGIGADGSRAITHRVRPAEFEVEILRRR